MAATPVPASAEAAAQAAMTINLFGHEIYLMSVVILFALAGLLYLFYRIQKTDKLDFADMITKDGASVSLTKVLQLLGGITATWVIIKMTSSGTLTEAVFGLYLTYVGAIEGYSKFVSAKYGYQEKSVKEVAATRALEAPTDEDGSDPSLKPPKV